jgi:hypothetical protein
MIATSRPLDEAHHLRVTPSFTNIACGLITHLIGGGSRLLDNRNAAHVVRLRLFSDRPLTKLIGPLEDSECDQRQPLCLWCPDRPEILEIRLHASQCV